MNKICYFILKDEEVSLSISLDQMSMFPKKIQECFFVTGKYTLNLNVDKVNLESFIDYMFNQNKQPNITVENAYDFNLLAKEFQIEGDFFSDPQNEDIINLSYIIKTKSSKERSEIEENISQNLDYYLEKYQDYMYTIPINSLYNIFSNVKRKLTNEENAYQFIIKGNDISLFVLLETLNSENLSEYSKEESLLKLKEHCGFKPKFDLSIFKDMEILFNKLYIANIKNRLNEMSNPTNEDKIRWPMELIQNAKDSLYTSPDEKVKEKVQISFVINHNPENKNLYKDVTFIHDGPPFSIDSYFGLIYKISQGKNNKKTTGKFGTGFLTTHVLSKTVYITGDRIENDKIHGFSIMMLREGREDDEIIDNLKKMRQSLKKSDTPYNLTKFNYPINSDISSECVKLGLNHLKKHISNVLINCSDIDYISIIEDNVVEKYYVSSVNKIDDFLYYYKINRNDDVFNEYIVVKNEVNNISISVNVNDQKMVIPRDKESESIYTVFPLVGSYAHILPFSINCPNFEPVTERNALILEGKETINNEKTKVWINRNILTNSVPLYEKLLNYLSKENYQNMVELSTGLILSIKPYPSFDLDWYNDNFLKEMRKILSNCIKVKTLLGKEIILSDTIFPSKEIEIQYIPSILNLKITNKYYPNIICEEDCSLWREKIWDSFNFVTITDLIEKVQNDNSILNEPQMPSLNEFLSFIFSYNKKLLENNPIIPNMNNVFKCMIENGDYLKSCPGVNDDIIQIMESIQIPWKENHMSKMINSIELPEDEMAIAENKIIEKINEDDSLSFELMKFVLSGDLNRQNMFDFVVEVGLRNYSSVIVSNVDKIIWEHADDYVLRKISESISSFNDQTVKEKMQFFLKFIPVCKEHFIKDENFFKSNQIIPNANYSLNLLDNLYNRSDIFHDQLNEMMIKYFQNDFNDKIIHPQINEFIKSQKDEQISDFLSYVDNNIENINTEDQIHVSEFIISLVPNDDNLGSSVTNQNEIFSIYTKLIKPDLKKISIEECYYSLRYWNKPNKIIINNICQTIDNIKTLKNLKEKYSLSEDDAFAILNFLYKFDFVFDNEQYAIIPNKDGIFKLKNELNTDPGISDEFYKLLSDLEPNSHIQDTIAHSKVSCNRLEKFDIQKFYHYLNNIMSDVMQNPDVDHSKIEKIHTFFALNISSGDNMPKNEKDKMEFLKKSHVTFIWNRLREISTPCKADFQRWPFELIQNATDCIQYDKKNDNQSPNFGSMTFEFLENKVIFTHYGLPFTNENFISLLYQYGGGKEDTDSQIGRFGTGFLSTMVLSKIVHISGDLINDQDNEIHGFEATIDRSGNNKEQLKEGIERMEKTLKTNEPIKGETKFIFEVPSSSNSKAYKEGLLSLKENIPQSLIFNQSIKSITLKVNDETLIFSRGKVEEQNRIITVKSDNQTTQKTFIYYEINDEFSYQPRSINKNVHINCLLEIGQNNNIIYHNDFLFLAFPIFGEKLFNSSIIINSLDFEPQKERKNLIIQLDENEEDSFESCINKFIIIKSVEMFKQIITIALGRNCTDLFNICHGLQDNSKIKFFQDNLIIKMREIILSFPIFETNEGYQKYDSILIPYIQNSSANSNFESEFYGLVSNLLINPSFISSELSSNPAYFVKFEQCKKWLSVLWSDFPSKININSFLKFVSDQKNTSQMKNVCKIEPDQFILKLIQFLEKMGNLQSMTSEYQILLNKENELVIKSNIYKYTLPDVYYEMMKCVNYDYLKNTLHDTIKYLYENNNIQFTAFDIKRCISTIKSNMNEENYVELMKFVITNNEKREKMFKYTKNYLNQNLEQITIDNIPDDCVRELNEMFKVADDYVIQKIIQHIQDQSQVEQIIDLLHDFISFLKDNISSNQFENARIFPNKNFELCLASDLKKDLIKNENLMNILKDVLHIDLKKQLIVDDFSVFSNNQKTCGYKDISSEIHESIKKYENEIHANEDNRINLYTIILNNSYGDEKAKKIVDLFNLLFPKKIDYTNSDDKSKDCFSYDIKQDILKMITLDINNYISKFSNIKDINELNEDQSIINEQLSVLYEYSLNFECSSKIFINDFGELKSLNEIKIIYDHNVKKEHLYKLLEFLIQLRQNDDIKNSILCKSIQIADSLVNKLEKNIINIDWFVKEFSKYNISLGVDLSQKTNNVPSNTTDNHSNVTTNISNPSTNQSNYSTSSNDSNSSNDSVTIQDNNNNNNYTSSDSNPASISRTISSSVNNNSNKPKIGKFDALEFIKFIKQTSELSIPFAVLLKKIDETLPLGLLENRVQLYSYFTTQKICNEIGKIIDFPKINDHKLETRLMIIAILYQKLKDSQLLSDVNCPALTNNSSDMKITANGNDYYFNMSTYDKYFYDISAKDKLNREMYFRVKITNIHLNHDEYNFVLNLKQSNIDNNYAVVLLDILNKISLQWIGQMNLKYEN